MADPVFVNGSHFSDEAEGFDVDAPAIAVASGNTILVAVSNYTGEGREITGVIDTAGNEYSLLASGGGDANHRMVIYVAYNAIPHAANVVTADFSLNAAFRVIMVAQYSGLPSGKFIDAATLRLTPNSTTHASNGITVGVENSWLFGAWVDWNGTAQLLSSSGGSSIRVVSEPELALADVSATGAGSKTIAIATDVNDQYAVLAVAFDTTGGASGDIEGQIQVDLELAGALSGTGALAGEIAQALSVAGALRGTGALSGDIQTQIALAGSLTGSAGLSTQIPLQVAVDGALAGTGSMAGSIAHAIGLVGQLDGLGALAGAIPLEMGVSGQLGGQTTLLGAMPMQLLLVGALTGTGALAAAIAQGLDLSGALSGGGALAGAISSSFDLSGALAVDSSMAGAMALELDLSGELTGTGRLEASIQQLLTLSGVLGGDAQIAGQVAMALSMAGALTDRTAVIVVSPGRIARLPGQRVAILLPGRGSVTLH